MSTKIQSDLRKILRETADGLTVNELSKMTGYLATSVRRVLTCNMPDVYVVNWREVPRCRPSALYKAVLIPENAPEPPRKMINVYKNKARDERPKAPKIKKQVAAQSVPSGLTTIRGPWPKVTD